MFFSQGRQQPYNFILINTLIVSMHIQQINIAFRIPSSSLSLFFFFLAHPLIHHTHTHTQWYLIDSSIHCCPPFFGPNSISIILAPYYLGRLRRSNRPRRILFDFGDDLCRKVILLGSTASHGCTASTIAFFVAMPYR